jgi:NAD(P)-dependent dehydrogenase (short-subunit alcohol dehydrogenase family)
MEIRDFRAKIVYLFGGSSGIGLETAKRLAAEGAHLVLFARNPERLRGALEAARRQRAADHQRFSSYPLDVTRHEEVVRTAERAVGENGPPDILINCVGRARPKTFGEIDYEQFDETIKVNLYGTWNTISALVPYMKDRGGRILNFSSVCGYVGVYGYTDYCAARFGVIGLSETLKSELRDFGISVQVICPPDTDTPGYREENRTKPPETAALSGWASLLQPERAAEMVVRALRTGRFLVNPGFMGKVVYLAKRLVPGFVDFMIRRDIRRVRRGKKH